MGLFSRKKPPEIGLYGKHPSAADFIRVNASSAELREFDQWLSNALAASARLAEERWEPSYRAGLPLSFLFGGQHRRCVLGALAPSLDQSGRLFPLIIFAEIERNLAVSDFPVFPHHPFFARAHALLARSATASRDEIQTLPTRIPADELNSFEGARQAHDRYLAGVRCGSAFGAMFGGGSRQAPLALREIEHFGRALASGRPPRYGLKFPLSQPAAGRLVSGPSVEGNAAFWLALLQQQAARPFMPSMVWSEAHMIVAAGQLPSRTLVGTWQPDQEDDQLCDLQHGKLPGPETHFNPDAALCTLLARC